MRKDFTVSERIGNEHGGDRKSLDFQVDICPLEIKKGTKTREIAAEKAGIDNGNIENQLPENFPEVDKGIKFSLAQYLAQLAKIVPALFRPLTIAFLYSIVSIFGPCYR